MKINCQFCGEDHPPYVTCIPYRDWVRQTYDDSDDPEEDTEILFI